MHQRENKLSLLPLFLKTNSTFLLLLFSSVSFAQNLVPNYSIENANCPTTYNGFPAGVGLMIPDWYSVTCTSPDAFTNCSNNAWTQVPNNLFGSQTARTGDNYLGFGMYGGWYDYVGAKLSCKLIAGNSYNVSFWLSRCDNARYAADEIGMYLSAVNPKMTCGFGNTVLTYIPQIKNTSGNYLTDQTSWTQVSGTYVASGGEEYITIGYFKAWNVIDFLDGGTGYSMPRSAYYIDDISVAGSGDCPLAIEEQLKEVTEFVETSSLTKVLYIPGENKIRITGKETVHTVSIWSMDGRQMELVKNKENEFGVDKITEGMYLFMVETDSEVVRTKLYIESH